MKYLYLFILIIFLPHTAPAQNMVHNPGFDAMVSCPISYSLLTYNYCSEWERSTQGTSDYFNSCNVIDVGIPSNFVGYQAAYNGNAYAGAYVYASADYREYLMGNLNWLTAGSFYKVTIHVSRAEGERYACDGFGVFFHEFGYGDTNIATTINVLPQIDYSGYGVITDSVNWVTLKDSFYADSAYKFIVIGNFHDNLNTNVQAMNLNNAGLNAYYYFDDIHVDAVPPFLTATLAQTNVSCYQANNATLSATAHGGVPPYHYLWVPGNYNSSSISNLAAGTYTLYLTDANNDTFKHLFHVTEPGQINVSTWQRNISCHAPLGSAAVSVFGGTPGYMYAWTPSGGTQDTAHNLAAGNYTCTITDSKGCHAYQPFTIVNAANLSATITQINAQCGNNGQLSMNVTGGTQPYHYFWSTGDTTAVISNIATGTYTCTVYDNDSCSQVKTISIVVPQGVTLSSTQHNIACAYTTGSATVIVNGGTPPYTYAWTPTGGNAATASNLTAGYYTCTVTDSKNCVATHVVSIGVPPNFVAGATHKNINCHNASGSATGQPNGGTGPYMYFWSTGDTTATINNLSAGTYTLTMVDNDSCISTTTVTITTTPPISATSTHTNILCYGHQDATATVSASGGNPPYSYAWSPSGMGTATVTGLAAGVYTFTVTDADTCSITDTLSIQDLSVPMNYSISDSTIDCRTAMVQATHESGDTVTRLVWLLNQDATDTSAENPIVHSFSQTAPNQIRLVLINQIGCYDTISYNLVLHYWTIANFTFTPPIPKQNAPIYFSDRSQGGVVSYNWDFGDSTHSSDKDPVKQYEVGGTYTVCLTVTDTIDCTSTVCKELTADILKLVDVPSAFSPNGDGENDVLYMRGFSVKTVKMLIYNRYGNEVFESDSLSKGWDGTFKGTPASSDVYAYVIDVTFADGSKQKKHGNVTLLR